MKYMKASEVALGREWNENGIQSEISSVFVDGFHQWLKFFSKDKHKLSKALAHMFNLDVFFVAMDGNRVAAITACTDGNTPCVRLQKQPLRRHLGIIMGTITYTILKKQFEEKPYPFKISNGMGTIEFVATAPNHRGAGVGTALITHILSVMPYSEYVLEVADTNTSALKLYAKLGFSEFMRVKEKHSKQSGVNFLVYMKKK